MAITAVQPIKVELPQVTWETMLRDYLSGSASGDQDL